MFLDTLLDNCATHADKTAIELLGEDGSATIVTYRQLEANVTRAMHYLTTLGVQPGDRVALQLPKCLSFVYLHLAAVRLGAISLPLNPAYPAQELQYYLADSEASLFFVDADDRKRQSNPMLPDLPSIRHCVSLVPDDHDWIDTLALDGDIQRPRHQPPTRIRQP